MHVAVVAPALLGVIFAGAFLARDLPREIELRLATAERAASVTLDRVQRALGTLSLGLASAERMILDDARLDLDNLEVIESLRTELPGLRTVLLIGPDGITRDETRAGAPAIGTDLSDRQYFRVHFEPDPPRRHLGDPIEGQDAGETGLSISTAIRDGDGHVLGVLVASVESAFFGVTSTLTDTGDTRILLHNAHDDTWIRLDRGDFMPRLEPSTLDPIAERINVPRGADSPTPGRLSTEEQVVLYRAIPPLPLHIVVMRDRDALWWEALAAALPAPGLILLAGLMVSGWTAVSQTRRRREQRQTDALREINDRLDLALTFGEIGIWDWDLGSGQVFMSETLRTLLSADGIEPDTTFTEFVVPEDRERFDAALRAHLDDGAPYDIAVDIVTREGRRLTISVAGHAERDEAGEPTRMLGIARDITSRRSLEKRLLEAERIAKVGHWSLDVETGALDWSPENYRIHGRDPDSVDPSRTVAVDSYLPEDRDRVNALLDRCITLGVDGECDATLLGEDGQVRFVRVTMRVAKDGQGKVIRIFGILQDRTDLVRTERELERSQRFDAFGQLAGGVAHDFNNLLAVMLGNLELLEEYEGAHLSDESRDFLREAIRSIARGRDLTQSLLSFARTAPLQPETTQSQDILDGVSELLRRTLPASTTLTVRDETADWSIHVDRAGMEACLINLAINARDAMDGAGCLTLVARQRRIARNDPEARQMQLEPGPYIAFEVSDTGSGIPPEVRDMVFEPFFTTKPVGSGSGLGLSRVKGFAEQSGGAASIDSRPGAGTTVTILLPAALRRDAAAAPPDTPETLVPARDGVAPRVLLVEDTGAVRRVIARQLAQMGLDVTTAETGDDAAELLTAGHGFDLLISDLVMPGALQGADLARMARRITPDLPVLLMTGYTEDRLHGSGEDLPCLVKPISIGDLGKAVGTLLQTAPREVAAASP